MSLLPQAKAIILILSLSLGISEGCLLLLRVQALALTMTRAINWGSALAWPWLLPLTWSGPKFVLWPRPVPLAQARAVARAVARVVIALR